MKHDLLITLDKERQIPFSRQIYEQVRNAIHSGALSGGDPLPPSRTLANQLGVSRSVILQSYELLQAEGYLEMRKGAGTFIAELTLEEKVIKDYESPYNFITKGPDFLTLNPPSTCEVDHLNPVFCDFRHGVPAWDAFPMDLWQKALMNACRRASPDTLGYGPAEGSLGLRREIARLLRSTRSMPVVPEQIVITSGATQALDILSRIFLFKGDHVIVEDPSHSVVREIFSFAGAEIIPVKVDQDGICVEEIQTNSDNGKEGNHKKSPKLVYVTPSHQFPFGTTLSLKRRVQLLDWAKANHAFIIEDDYDSEYRYEGPKLSALAGLDVEGRVIYVGSFSKVLFPSLRIGYVVLPPALIQPFLAVKWITDRMSSALDQEALAEFIQNGHYARHITQMGKLYASRRACLVNSLNTEFGSRVRYYGEEAGLHLLIELESNAEENRIAEVALRYGVRVYPASSYFMGSRPKGPVFLLGYSNLTENQIKMGVNSLMLAETEAAVNSSHL
ncbi:PLP-dependent aminotransferase family protein [Paenibacillus sp. G2S3]|uniref:MocR-like pyridoxine biosynthesis transcription factor PdxR n=1 Tax=Paenibacillus sp. G2S3 TaxID=3047872 RepID=UPI0024C197D4|nr:PLP-dependent aminotransferase family protein [Paenibacillus sp. G2S3]WHY21900.1 PLP-dependent aminotransferase family protein [Paenibacillus sp. G2S3]